MLADIIFAFAIAFAICFAISASFARQVGHVLHRLSILSHAHACGIEAYKQSVKIYKENAQ